MLVAGDFDSFPYHDPASPPLVFRVYGRAANERGVSLWPLKALFSGFTVWQCFLLCREL